MTSPNLIDLCVFEQVLRTVAPAAFLDQLCREHDLKCRRGIYTLTVVIWLMIYQRLSGKGTLSAAVQFLARHAVHWQNEGKVCKRIREHRISTGTGGYCQARLKVPTLIASNVCDHIFEQLQILMRAELPEAQRPVFVVDGTTLRLAHERELKRAFPPGHNQHGDNHWPTLLMVALHDVHTGLATQPSWGAMYGPRAVGEQELARRALQRLPADAVVLGDGDFGIFAFAHAVHQSQRPMVLRLTVARAHKLLQGKPLTPGRRRQLEWEPSRWDRTAHPALPDKAVVKGWVVVCRNPAHKGELLYFFSTLDLKAKRLLALYKLRWNIETDLRSLKRTLDLHQLTSKTKAMVEKEVLLAVCAYNLVRAVMYLSATSLGLTPRQFSFSAAQDAVMAAWPYLQRAHTPAEVQQELERLLAAVAKTRLPVRSRKRSYPRAVWGRGGHFPARHSPHRETNR
jgi:putative transposase